MENSNTTDRSNPDSHKHSTAESFLGFFCTCSTDSPTRLEEEEKEETPGITRATTLDDDKTIVTGNTQEAKELRIKEHNCGPLNQTPEEVIGDKGTVDDMSTSSSDSSSLKGLNHVSEGDKGLGDQTSHTPSCLGVLAIDIKNFGNAIVGETFEKIDQAGALFFETMSGETKEDKHVVIDENPSTDSGDFSLSSSDSSTSSTASLTDSESTSFSRSVWSV